MVNEQSGNDEKQPHGYAEWAIYGIFVVIGGGACVSLTIIAIVNITNLFNEGLVLRNFDLFAIPIVLAYALIALRYYEKSVVLISRILRRGIRG